MTVIPDNLYYMFFSPFPLPLTFGGGRGEGPEVRALGRHFNDRKKCKPVFPAN
jgi:hypothetical protein